MQSRVRTNALTGYAEVARSVGLDPVALMARLGLADTDLDVPDRWIPGAPVARLLELSAEESGCPDFGLRMADHRRLGTLGPLSVVLRDEPDLRGVVDLLSEYEHAYNEALHLRLEGTDGVATIAVWLEFGRPAPCDQALDLVMAILLGIIRTLVRPDWEPLLASFARPAPEDPEPWHRLFGPRVAFDRRVTGLVIRSGELATPTTTSDSSVRPYTREFLRSVVVPRSPGADQDLAAVGDAVELLLPLGRCSIQRVSRRLGLSPRSLQRYLADHGETFSSVVHATRARLAERYLPNDRYSLTEVSRLLGFQAPSAFSRWFQQQFGTSPTQWRRSTRARATTGVADGTTDRHEEGAPADGG